MEQVRPMLDESGYQDVEAGAHMEGLNCSCSCRIQTQLHDSHHHFSWPGMVRECKPQHFSSTGSQVMLGAAPSDIIRLRVVRAETGTCPQQQEHLCGAGGLAVEEGGASKGANHRAPVGAHAQVGNQGPHQVPRLTVSALTWHDLRCTQMHWTSREH